jgi:hypothetical protein
MPKYEFFHNQIIIATQKREMLMIEYGPDNCGNPYCLHDTCVRNWGGVAAQYIEYWKMNTPDITSELSKK